ncbi:hypothetical protein Bhyg_08157 [Pseudolycoriella hygida]|uniref:Uncharacterized protein n=1 Tax=Pseudolycoriella hygida TaxID=35572 RepID=A0A9Q0N4B4_9DIPT|nr:hypothetical protein Bhyg_08157 [Pseudolycoriella hygida]
MIIWELWELYLKRKRAVHKNNVTLREVVVCD